MDEARTPPPPGALTTQVFFPSSFQELFSVWSRFPEAVPCSGGVEFLRRQGSRVPLFPASVLSLDRMKELRRVSRTERYLETGAAVTFNEIIALGKAVPAALLAALLAAGDRQLRNSLTIGGSVCNSRGPFDAAAPLTVLDAHYELRSASGSRWLAASRFHAPAPEDKTAAAPERREILTRIRIPLEEWDYSLCRKLAGSGGGRGGSAFLLARQQKNTLTSLRVLFAGNTLVRDKAGEAALTGKKLPLSGKDTGLFIDTWSALLASLDDEAIASPPLSAAFLKARFLSFLKSALPSFTE